MLGVGVVTPGLLTPLQPHVRPALARHRPARAAVEEASSVGSRQYGSKRAVFAGIVQRVSLADALREYERKQLYKQRWRRVLQSQGYTRERGTTISVAELAAGLDACDFMRPETEELRELVARACPDAPLKQPPELCEVDETRRVDFNTFIWTCEQFCEELELCEVDLAEDENLSEQTLRAVFDQIGREANKGPSGPQWARGPVGYLSARELKQVLENVGLRVPPMQQLRAIVASYDSDRDGRLDFAEFRALALELAADRQDLASEGGEEGSAAAAAAVVAAAAAAAASDAAAPDGAAPPMALDVGEATLVDEQVKAFFVRDGAFDEPLGVQEVQDALHRRFCARYVDAAGEGTDPAYRATFPASYLGVGEGGLSDDQRALLGALREGDVATIRELMRIPWDFVYPPAAADRADEGWCRSPLALLVRPNEGNFGRFLPGVSAEERYALIEEALTRGCADPNFPRLYWSGPAAHACFEGDVGALKLLADAGCDLSQRVEWVLQPAATFSLVHAAAFNGNRNVLEFLLPRVSRDVVTSVDADGSNALHTLLESSRDLETARYLLGAGIDGFVLNKQRRSPLSMAIEVLPPLAADLLKAKYRFEYRWWGNDLYWYSFDGVVLPCTDEGKALPVADTAGEETSIEELIVRHERKELLKLPVMRTILERKWRWFERSYQREVVQYVCMVTGVFLASVCDVDQPPFALGAAVALGAWALFLRRELGELAAKGAGPYTANRVDARWKVRGLLNLLDSAHLALLPAVPLAKLAAAQGALPVAALGAVTPLAAVLQITLSLRALQYISLYRSLGPLLVTVVSMFSDTVSFVGIYVFVLLAFANGLYVVLSAGGVDGVDYGSVVETQLLWLLGNIDLEYFNVLDGAPVLKDAGLALFWAYTLLSSFILLNLLIAIFNSTYERVAGDRDAEWLWLRLEAMLSFESDLTVTGLDEYYTELQELNNQRTVDRLEQPRSQAA